MHCSLRNSYLQQLHGCVSPVVLNRCIDQGMLRLPLDSLHPLLKLCSSQPRAIGTHYDFTRRTYAFRNETFRQLKIDLSSYDPDIQMRAVTTFSDLIMDPEQVYQIIKYGIPYRLCKLLDTNHIFLMERVCKALTKLASDANGKMAIVKNKKILEKFKAMILKGEPVKILNLLGNCLIELSSFWLAADCLKENGFILIILRVVPHIDNDIACILLSVLKNMMYEDGVYFVMERGGFHMMTEMAKRWDEGVQIASLTCLGMMTATSKGKQLALDTDLLQTLNRMLWRSVEPEMDAAIMTALMFCTMRHEALQVVGSMPGLIPRLINYCRTTSHKTVQLYTFETLLNLASHPKLRAFLKQKYEYGLKKILSLTEKAETVKQSLLVAIAKPILS